MSKIGRKPIDVTGVAVTIEDKTIDYKGSLAQGSYKLDPVLNAEVRDNMLYLTVAESAKKDHRVRELNRIWGMHRALLSNKILGAKAGFSKKVSITGLGYKAAVSGKNVVFTLGYSHKINFTLPESVTLDVDKSGQNLIVKSTNKDDAGEVASKIRFLRPPEPYKGTGIKVGDEQILRKAGKTKAG